MKDDIVPHWSTLLSKVEAPAPSKNPVNPWLNYRTEAWSSYW